MFGASSIAGGTGRPLFVLLLPPAPGAAVSEQREAAGCHFLLWWPTGQGVVQKGGVHGIWVEGMRQPYWAQTEQEGWGGLEAGAEAPMWARGKGPWALAGELGRGPQSS